ncbi:hypothetical protein EN780_31870, partial [Mesorhizobium sp. M4B.F.Ca.ET.089.01.1.1]|uniref:hypothetical protein n=1 Tax=Mesorhizobium sp. M4B.F.Ca.ET.089.01.1.1 TaxID=2496662 RepID=UPI000FF28A35
MHGHHHPDGSNNPLTSPLGQQGVMRQFFRVWRSGLSLGERDLFGFILDCTVNWGKTSCRLTYRNIAQAGGSTETRARSFLKALENKGAITVTQFPGDPKGMLIEVNIDWEPAGKCQVKNSAAPAPKRKPLTTNTIDQALYHAYDDARSWPEKHRRETAQCIVAICSNDKLDVDNAILFAKNIAMAWPGFVMRNEAPKHPDAGFIRKHATGWLVQFRENYDLPPLKRDGVTPTQMRGGSGSTPTQTRGADPRSNEGAIIGEGQQEKKEQEKSKSATASRPADAPAPAKETAHPIRQ